MDSKAWWRSHNQSGQTADRWPAPALVTALARQTDLGWDSNSQTPIGAIRLRRRSLGLGTAVQPFSRSSGGRSAAWVWKAEYVCCSSCADSRDSEDQVADICRTGRLFGSRHRRRAERQEGGDANRCTMVGQRGDQPAGATDLLGRFA